MNTRGPNNGDADPEDDGDLDVLDEVSNARGDVEEDLSNLEEDDDDDADTTVATNYALRVNPDGTVDQEDTVR